MDATTALGTLSRLNLLIVLSCAMLLTRVGFVLYSEGLVRAKNSAGMVVRILCDICISILAFWAVGAAILVQSNNQWFSLNRHLLVGWQIDQTNVSPIFLFYLAIVLTATGVVAGTTAERCRFIPMCVSSLVLGALVFPVAGHWTWAGWLKQHGFLDLAGGSALHVSAAVFAAVAAAFVGPRIGKYNRDGSSAMIPGHNLPLACVGALILFVGWIPYVAAASLGFAKTGFEPWVTGLAAINVLLAGAAGLVGGALFGQFRFGKPDVLLTLTGLLGGLVSVCAGGALLPNWAAVIVGLVAGVTVPLVVVLLDLRARLDDPLGVISIHGIGGAWGTIAAGLFITPSAPSRLQQVAIQIIGLLLIAAFSGLAAFITFAILKATTRLRARETDELEGLDLADHDIGAYPDFQQNTIKSYHLREA